MSTSALPGPFSGNPADKADADSGIRDLSMKAVHALASLKLTVCLFSLAMVIVFVGSLAQSRRDVWLVMSQYFRTYLAWIDVADLFPPSMFPGLSQFNWDSLRLRYIPFPGGWLIGWVMLANLTAAHALKFRIRAQGMKFASGIGVLATGIALTAVVIITGNAQTGVETGNFAMTPQQIWYTLLGVLGITALICGGSAAFGRSQSRSARILLGLSALVLISVLSYFIAGGDQAQLNVSSMRILWQLLKGSACSLVMLIGCNMLFDKRGGIVLLHLGVALLMFSELQVGLYGKENMLTLEEGQTSSFLRDIRERELAITYRMPDGKEKVVVVPQAMLESAASAAQPEQQLIRIDSLPFDIAVRKFFLNSRLRPAMPDDESRTEEGLASFAVPVELEPVTGMDDSNDQSSAYVDLIERGTDRVLSSLLLSQNVSEFRAVPIAEQAKVGDTDYQFYLRFQRNYRDYEVKLLDVSRTNYVGSSTPRDYRSTIVIRDPETNTDEQFTLWMNNPLRYRGETFYQSGYNQLEDGKEATTLSVVRNTGWMLPYIACMIVSFGMFAQFWQTVGRYLKREERGTASMAPIPESRNNPYSEMPGAATAVESGSEAARTSSVWTVGVPVVAVLVSLVWLVGEARTPADVPDAMNLFSFAQLPVAWNGRAQPIDSFARTQLLMTSHKSTFKGELDPAELDAKRERLIEAFSGYWPSVKTDSLKEFSGSYTEWIDEFVRLTSSGRDVIEERMRPLMIQRMEAVRWFLDVAARPEVAARHRVIKIDDDQVLSLLGLEKRSGLTYSMAEIQENLKELQPINAEVLKLRRDRQDNSLTTLQRRVGALFETVSRIDSMQNMFLMRDSENLMSSLVDSWRILRILGNQPAVMAVPTGNENEQRSWETLVASNALLQLVQQMEQRNIRSEDELLAYMQEKLPAEIVSRAVVGSYGILQSAVEAKDPGKPAAAGVRTRAAGAAAAVPDPFLRRILAVIAAAPADAAPEDIAAGLSSEEMRDIASERISSDLFEIFSTLNSTDPDDPRLLTMRKELQQIGAADEAQLASAMNEKLARLAFADLRERAGHLLPGGEDSATFTKNASAFTTLLAAWRNSDVERFNQTIAEYRTTLAGEQLPHLDPQVVRTEAWFNFYEPFYKATSLYLPVIVLSFIGWLFWGPSLRRTSFALMLLAFLLHTGALLIRMWISGRPPVTNLYSSAIFIGWAVVVSAFFIELRLRNGIGNILGASVGAATLTIAHYLARDEGDTLGVMQAVLDTTFWLATHVVCITLGYAATFLAGGIALVYCVRANMKQTASSDRELKSIGQLVYGVLCFALFFSLVGTVLGGLWADDSWGRFWGWDPKENGAMLIVLWNALILHARWDKLVRDYGTAVLAMIGNVVTAWSWFGVNELKAGLHTYGFTEGRLLALAIFVGLQLGVVVLALIPTLWRRRSGLT